MLGILGKKIGMTNIFDESGKNVPITVIEAGPCYVLQVKTKAIDGYDAIQISFGQKREKLVNKPDLARYKKAGVSAGRFVKELRVKDPAQYKAGQMIIADIFAKGDFLDVVGTSIGKGFQGGVKRWGWKGGNAGHGSMFGRVVGSIQSGARLGRVTKGHHMPGHMGADTVTVKNLKIIKVDAANNLLLIKGAVPGFKTNYLILKKSAKKPKVAPLKVEAKKEVKIETKKKK